MGVVGLPVFAGFQGGMGSLLGSGDISFVSNNGLCYFKIKNKSLGWFSTTLGSVICYFIGTLWFMFVKMNS